MIFRSKAGDLSLLFDNREQEGDAHLISSFECVPESVRSAAVSRLLHYLDSGASLNLGTRSELLLTLMGRFKEETCEPSEEIRLKLVLCAGRIVENMSGIEDALYEDIISFMAISVTDVCPDVRKASCDLVAKIFANIVGSPKDRIASGQAFPHLVKNVSMCLRSKQWKIRSAGILALRALLGISPSMPCKYLTEYWENFNHLINDRSVQVLGLLAACISFWLRMHVPPDSSGWKLFYCLVGLVLHSSEEMRGIALKEVQSVSSLILEEASDRWEIVKDLIPLGECPFVKAFFNLSETVDMKMHAKCCISYAVEVLCEKLAAFAEKDRKRHALRVLCLLAVHCNDHDGMTETILSAVQNCLLDPDLIDDKPIGQSVPKLLAVVLTLDSVVPVVFELLLINMKNNRLHAARIQLNILDILTAGRREIHQLQNEVSKKKIMDCTKIGVAHPSLASSCLGILDRLVRCDAPRDQEKIVSQLIACRANLPEGEYVTLWESVFARCDREIVRIEFSNALSRARLDRQSLVTLCRYIEGRFMCGELLDVLAQWSASADYLEKLDALEILSIVTERESDLSTDECDFLVDHVIAGLCEWKSGLVHSKFRKAGLSSYRNLLLAASVSPSCAERSLKFVLDCMDDLYSPDNRLLALLVVERLIPLVSSSETAAPVAVSEVSKRLDDSQNLIRAEAARIVAILVGRFQEKLEESISMLKIHENDPDEKVKISVENALSVLTQH